MQKNTYLTYWILFNNAIMCEVKVELTEMLYYIGWINLHLQSCKIKVSDFRSHPRSKHENISQVKSEDDEVKVLKP